MSHESKKKITHTHKNEDGKFHSKTIKHDPQAEGARAVFGLNKGEDNHGHE